MSDFSSRKPMRKTEKSEEKISATNSRQRLDSGYPETPLPQDVDYPNALHIFPPPLFQQSMAQRDWVAAEYLIVVPCDITFVMKNSDTNTVYYNHGKEIYTIPDQHESKADAKTGFYKREDSAYFTSPKLEDLNSSSTEGGKFNWQIGSQMNLAKRGITSNYIMFEGFSNECSRLLSYLIWPKNSLQNLIHSFVRAGFFYTSQNDWLQCYVCGVRICDWQNHHNPLIEHARHQPHCPLVTTALQNVNFKHVKCVTRTVEIKLIERAEEEKFFMILMLKNQTL